MATIVWDAIGSRTYETGISRGVVYPPDEEAVPWNGLVSVEEVLGPTPTSYYLDGIKFLNRATPGDYVAKVRAITYPEVLEELLGVSTYGAGLLLMNQKAKRFGLTYRSDIGDDVVGPSRGYKIHLIYNALATQTTKVYQTRDSSVALNPIEWQIDAIPEHVDGFRPTAHFVIDTSQAAEEAVVDLEAMLYGTPSTPPTMPTADELLNLFVPGPSVIDNEDGSFTITGDDDFFTITGEDDSEFSIKRILLTHRTDSEYTMRVTES